MNFGRLRSLTFDNRPPASLQCRQVLTEHKLEARTSSGLAGAVGMLLAILQAMLQELRPIKIILKC